MEYLVGTTRFLCRTLLIGERIDVRSPTRSVLAGDRIDLHSPSRLQGMELHRLATAPLTVRTDPGGVVVLFRYGAVVLFDVGPAEEAALLERLKPFVSVPFAKPDVDEVQVCVDPNVTEGVEDGVVVLRNHEVERLQVVAENTGKSAILALYEARVGESFDHIEPFALEIGITGVTSSRNRELLRHLGTALRSQHQMAGRVQPAEKPDVLWERPDLEVLNHRIADEFEIRERNIMLERKLDLIARTSQILLDLLQDRRTLRVEWYVVGLIVFEIVLTLYQILKR